MECPKYKVIPDVVKGEDEQMVYWMGFDNGARFQQERINNLADMLLERGKIDANVARIIKSQSIA